MTPQEFRDNLFGKPVVAVEECWLDGTGNIIVDYGAGLVTVIEAQDDGIQWTDYEDYWHWYDEFQCLDLGKESYLFSEYLTIAKDHPTWRVEST